MWSEDSTRADLLRLAKALDHAHDERVHRVFRIVFAATAPPKRPRYDMMETQRIVVRR